MFSPSLAFSRQALKQCCKVGPYQNDGMRVYDSKYGPRYTLPGTNENLQEATGTCDMMHSNHLPHARDKTKAGTEREGGCPCRQPGGGRAGPQEKCHRRQKEQICQGPWDPALWPGCQTPSNSFVSGLDGGNAHRVPRVR